MQNREGHSAARPLLVVLGGLAFVAILAWLAFGLFGIQSAFTSTKVTEAGPAFQSGANGSNALGSAEFDAAMEEAAAHPKQVNDNMMPGKITTLAEGRFSGHTGHSVEGKAAVLNDGTKQRFLRLEEFQSTNGPDLKVYLRAGNDKFVSLGDLKGNIGSQNYEIPADVDLAVFHTVQIWCERFGVLFGDAALA
jgi:Electron transfer DM13